MQIAPDIREAILAKASEHKLDPHLVEAFVIQESGGNPRATRFEPAYKWTYFPEKCAYDLNISKEVELKNQMTSWGLMQVMGALARELGFQDHLENLLLPLVSLEYGCLRLRSLFSHTGYSRDDVISAYNQGGRYKTPGGFYYNQKYVDSVCAIFRAIDGPPAPSS